MGCAVRHWPGRAWGWTIALLLAIVPLAAGAEATKAQEEAVKHLLATYERAIETKDLALFRSVKPNLTDDEGRRLRKAFDSTKTQEVTITIAGVDCQDKTCVVRLNRRDTIDASIVSSFPQTMRLSQSPDGFVIEEIGR
jgi:hypothetical protein